MGKNYISVEQATLVISTVGLVTTQQGGYVRCESAPNSTTRFYLGASAAAKRIGRIDLSGFPANIHLQLPGVITWAEGRMLGIVPEAPSKKVTHCVDFTQSEVDILATLYRLARFVKPQTQEEQEEAKAEAEHAAQLAKDEAEAEELAKVQAS
jgi:sulfite reductase alpha subunit-like flavoprotein